MNLEMELLPLCTSTHRPSYELDIMDLAAKSSPHLETYSEYYILRFLLDAPDFNFKAYGAHRSPLFDPPPPIHALPCSSENRMLQYQGMDEPARLG